MRANIAMARGEAVAAITDLRAVLRDQPNAVLVMRALARAHLQNGEPALAEEVLRNAMQVNQRDVATRMDLATFLAQSGRYEDAKPLLEQIVLDAPTDVAVRQGLLPHSAGAVGFRWRPRKWWMRSESFVRTCLSARACWSVA